jgi:antitoxin HigA-1
MYKMHNPPHPGEVLKDSVLRMGGGVTIAEFAKRLRVSHGALSRVVNGKAEVSAELAIRLAAALHGSAESWLRMQLVYDLWHAQRKKRPKIEPAGLQPVNAMNRPGGFLASATGDVQDLTVPMFVQAERKVRPTCPPSDPQRHRTTPRMSAARQLPCSLIYRIKADETEK